MKLANFESYTLLHSIASRIYASAGAKSEKFAIMSAMHIIGSAAQLSWKTATGISLSFYQIFAAHAGYGKDHYRKAIKSYIYAIDSALEAQKPASVQGLVTELLTWNTLSMTVDEYDQWMEKLLKNPGTAEIKDMMLSLYLGDDYMSGSQLKKQKVPRVEKPRLSVCGFCTVKGLISLMTRNILQGGFFSRCLVWDENEIDVFTFDTPRSIEIDPYEIDWLKKIYMPDNEKPVQSKDDNFDRLTKDANKNYKHESIYHLEHKIEVGDEAVSYISDLRMEAIDKFNKEARSIHEKDDDNTGSFSRYPFMVERIAGILALSRTLEETPCINAEDARLADTIMHEHRDGVARMLEYRHDNDYHRKKKQLLQFLKQRQHQNIVMYDLRNILESVNLSTKHAMLLSLYEEGIISIMQGDKPVDDLELRYGKIPRGCTFRTRSL